MTRQSRVFLLWRRSWVYSWVTQLSEEKQVWHCAAVQINDLANSEIRCGKKGMSGISTLCLQGHMLHSVHAVMNQQRCCLPLDMLC